MNHYYAQMMENSFRMERMERRATLISSLGPRPESGLFRLFRRTVVPLAAEVTVTHSVPALRDVEAGTRERQAA